MPIHRPACAILLLLVAGAAPAQEAAPQAPDSAAEEEIVVNGRFRRCQPIEDEPLDQLRLGNQYGRQMVLKADREGRFKLQPDDDPITGPVIWQRAGTAIGDYVYASPTDGGRLCIGAGKRKPDGWGQLRRVLDAKPFHGKYVVFTAYAMSSRAGEARFWLAAGDERVIYKGGDTRLDPIVGNVDWLPVRITIGPIPRQATKISYGVVLQGRGDVWVDAVKLETAESVEADPGAVRLRPVS